MFNQIWTIQGPDLGKYLETVVPGFRQGSNHYHAGWPEGHQNSFHSTYELSYMLSDEFVDVSDDYGDYGPTGSLAQINDWLEAIDKDNRRRNDRTIEYLDVRDYQPNLDTLFWWLVRYKGLELPSTEITVLEWW